MTTKFDHDKCSITHDTRLLADVYQCGYTVFDHSKAGTTISMIKEGHEKWHFPEGAVVK